MNNKFTLHSFIPLSLCFFFILIPLVHCQLDYNFYRLTCPNLSGIVRGIIWSAIQNDTRMPASLLRLHFHDCIVNGCDASVLLDDTGLSLGEKSSGANKNSARGFELIDSIKIEVEKACNSTVSCADILALATREAVYLAGGPSGGLYWPVFLGRRDGTTSSKSDADAQIPSPFESLDEIIKKFTDKGLDVKDVAVLSGAHTIGFAQCFTFKSRLFNFNSTGKPDPTLDSSLLQNLQSQCPNEDSSDTKLNPLDPVTTNKFDNVYYTNLLNNSGLLQSDQALLGDSRTSSLVNFYSKYPLFFLKDFGTSMIKLGNISVLTGKNGEIRKNCRVVN